MNSKKPVNPTALRSVQKAWAEYQNSTSTSQSRAAKAIGMNQSAFSQYLRGDIPLNTEFLAKLSTLTKIDLGVAFTAVAPTVRGYTLPVRYTLSGRLLRSETLLISSLVPVDGCYGIRVDYRDHCHQEGTILLVDDTADVKSGDTVVYARPDEPIVYGTLGIAEDGWEILEPHAQGGRSYLVSPEDDITRIVGSHLPARDAKTFIKK
jgi:transcriptional regulator with XRE-family HTH domain